MAGPASLSTHVLDLTSGRPAAGMRVELARLSDGAVIADVTTNADGRTDAPLIAKGQAVSGAHELRFHVGDYFGTGRTTPFLDVVPIRFGLEADGGHYHVPLLASPYGYSTYRGS
jgi:5-hydroxyisourate hydrolase